MVKSVFSPFETVHLNPRKKLVQKKNWAELRDKKKKKNQVYCFIAFVSTWEKASFRYCQEVPPVFFVLLASRVYEELLP